MMDKLDENYLDLVRKNLYGKEANLPIKCSTTRLQNSKKQTRKVGGNEETPKNRVRDGFKTKKENFKAKAKLQNKSKIRKVSFLNDTSQNKPESSSANESSKEVKHRVATPFKNTEAPVKLKTKKKSPSSESEQHKIFSTVAKTLSPSLNENDRITFGPSSDPNYDTILVEVGKKNNGKGKKRLLSHSDSPEVIMKRKKEKSFTNTGKKLLFDDCLDDSALGMMVNGRPDVGQNKKKISKKKKTKNKSLVKDLDIISTLDTTLENEAELEQTKAWGNFIYSPEDEKNRGNAEKPMKKLKNKIKNQTNNGNGENVNSNAIDNSHKASALISEKGSKGLVTDSSTVVKKSDYKNGKQRKKLKKLKTTALKPAKHQESIKNSIFSDMLDYLNSSSDVDFNLKRNSGSIVEDPAEFSDSCDNETVGVKGLKFQIFCDLFCPTYNQQFSGYGNTLRIPKRYFKVSENDFESDRQSEELPRPAKKKGNRLERQKQSNASGKNEVQENTEVFEETKEMSHLDSSNEGKKQKKINILDVQIMESPAEHFADTIGDQKTDKDIVNVQETLPESVNLKQTDNNIENLSLPVIIALKNGQKIVALNLGEEIHFHGLCLIKVLNGKLEILGGNLKSSSGERKLYSPRGTSLLYIRNKCRLFVDSSVELKHLVPKELLLDDNVNVSFKEHYAIFVCSELREPHIDFVESYVSQIIFPDSSTQALRVDFKVQGSWNKVRVSEKWEEVIETIPEDSKTVICGGKGVGKSTFLRYTVNALLSRFKKIRVIDLDPGQSEFYSPGCISVVTVDKEVFGPNYTHLLEPESSILSHINMGHDINKYLLSVKYLLESTKAMDALPTLINFPGFTQGIGLDISAQSLKLLDPSLVIQIDSKSRTKNYKVDLTADNVCRTVNEENVLKQDESNDCVDLSYDFVKLDSLAESNEAWSLEARQGREINILSYFGKLMNEKISDLTSPDINMYSISISALSITNLEGKAISPLTINANLVALCSKIDQHNDIFSCHGYGFVRGMDLQTDLLVLITPESIETLDKVSHLVLSSVTTPPSLMMTASGITGHIPYVSVGDPVDFGQFTRRSYIPPRKST